jgi:hypothetical protein
MHVQVEILMDIMALFLNLISIFQWNFRQTMQEISRLLLGWLRTSSVYFVDSILQTKQLDPQVLLPLRFFLGSS